MTSLSWATGPRLSARWRASPSLAVLALLLNAFFVACSERPPERRIVAERWDTIFQYGSEADTVLQLPVGLYLWNDRIVVADALAFRISVFSPEGRLLWSFGRKGDGPGEFRAAYAAAMAADGNLWVLDPEAQRISEISADGELIAEVSTRTFPSLPLGMAVLSDRQFFPSWDGTNRLSVIETTLPDPDELGTSAVQDSSRVPQIELRVLNSRPLPWPDTMPERWLKTLAVAADGRTNWWVSAFRFGPGFISWQDTVPSTHFYLDPVPFQTPGGRVRLSGGGSVPSGRDTIRWAAHQVAVTDHELFVLFGGRPQTLVQAAEPVVLIDVYERDGSYDRSYRLPFDVEGMVTDGETFYVVTTDPYPALFALRPRPD